MYTAPLLVILHKIPLARRVLLNESIDILSDYGFSDDWWKGHLIDLATQFEDHVDSPIYSNTRLMIEVQRLMAFLDGQSRRPYASILNLSHAHPISSLSALKGESSDITPVGRFLKDVSDFWDPESPLRSTFETCAVNPSPEPTIFTSDFITNTFKNNNDKIKPVNKNQESTNVSDQSDIEKNTEMKDAFTDTEDVEEGQFSNFVVDVSVAFGNDTLYDLIDDLVWSMGKPPVTYLSRVSDIITITLKRDDAQSGAGIDVPTMFFPDRYTKPFLPYMRQLYELRKKSQEAITALSKKRFEMSTYMGRDTTKVLQTTSEYLNSLIASTEKDKGIGKVSLPSSSFDLSGIVEAALDVENANKQLEAKKTALIDEIQYHRNFIALQKTLFKGGDDKESFKTVFGDPLANKSNGLPGFTDIGTSGTSTSSGPDNTINNLMLSQPPPSLKPYRLSGVIISPVEYCFCVKTKSNDEIPDLIMVDEEEDDEDNNDEKLEKTDRVADSDLKKPASIVDLDIQMKDISASSKPLSTLRGKLPSSFPDDHLHNAHLDDSEGAESSASTAAASSDSAQTAVSTSQNLYEWYKVIPSEANELSSSLPTPYDSELGKSLLEAVPVITKISVPEMLELAKQGSTLYSSQEVILVYATEEEAWSESKHNSNLIVGGDGNGPLPLSMALAEFIDKDRHALMNQIQNHERLMATESISYADIASGSRELPNDRRDKISLVGETNDESGSEVKYYEIQLSDEDEDEEDESENDGFQHGNSKDTWASRAATGIKKTEDKKSTETKPINFMDSTDTGAQPKAQSTLSELKSIYENQEEKKSLIDPGSIGDASTVEVLIGNKPTLEKPNTSPASFPKPSMASHLNTVYQKTNKEGDSKSSASPVELQSKNPFAPHNYKAHNITSPISPDSLSLSSSLSSSSSFSSSSPPSVPAPASNSPSPKLQVSSNLQGKGKLTGRSPPPPKVSSKPSLLKSSHKTNSSNTKHDKKHTNVFKNIAALKKPPPPPPPSHHHGNPVSSKKDGEKKTSSKNDTRNPSSSSSSS